MSVETLETGLRELMAKVYNNEFTEWRRNQFFRRLRQNRRRERLDTLSERLRAA
jgi:hypothetical protein